MDFYELEQSIKHEILETVKYYVAYGYEDYYCTTGNAPDGPKYKAVEYEKVRKSHDKYYPSGISIDDRRIRDLAYSYIDSGIGETTSDCHDDVSGLAHYILNNHSEVIDFY